METKAFNECVRLNEPRASARADYFRMTIHSKAPGRHAGGFAPIASTSEATGRPLAFTLIELLVVVAMIALLLCILIPSLKRARDQAASAVCAANLAQTCKAEGCYQSENDGWIPGSPWTTGYWFLTSPSYAQWDPALPLFNRFAVNMFDHVTPLRAITLGRHAVSRDRKTLFKEMTLDPYGCPSSSEVAVPWSGSHVPQSENIADMPTIKAPSHLTMYSIMRAGSAMYERVANNTVQYPSSADEPDRVAQYSKWEIVVPSGYMPRHSWLGREQLKVFVADGLRYASYDTTAGTTNNTVVIDYDVSTFGKKGISSATPPSTGGDPAFFAPGFEYNGQSRPYSYRHGDNNRINAGFFDGHVEGLKLGPDRDAHHYTGRAVHPQYYYPSRSVVQDPTKLHMAHIPAGTVLP
jgi:prepilin-type processing-associated H-X9-DG protein